MIGIFGSDTGGLFVMRRLTEQLPDYDMLYRADTARAPYASKGAATVSRFTLENLDWLLEQGARMLVLTCNTAAAVALSKGQSVCDGVPVFDTVTAAVASALSHSQLRRIGVMADHTDIDCGVYSRLIHAARPDARVFPVACPLLAALAEEGWGKKPVTRMIVKKYLHPLKIKRIDTLILANPHHGRLASVIQNKIGRRVKMVTSGEGVGGRIRYHLARHPELERSLPRSGRLRLVFTDRTARIEEVAGGIFNRSLTID
jgi:glutamate racemase